MRLRDHVLDGRELGEHLEGRGAPRAEPLLDQLLPLHRLGPLAELLGEVERLAAAEVAQRAQDQERAARRGHRRRAPRHQAGDARPLPAGPAGRGLHARDRGPERAPSQGGEHGGKQGQAGGDHDRDPQCEQRAHLAGGVEVGDREDEHRGDDDRAGGEDGRPGLLGRAGHRRARILGGAQLVAIAGDDQQAVVRPHAEHQHDQDRRRLPAHGRQVRGHEAVDQAGRDQVRQGDHDQRHRRHQRRAVDREQQGQQDRDRDEQQGVVDPLDRGAPVRVEARLAGHIGAQARLVAGGRRDDGADRRRGRLGDLGAPVGHQRGAEHDAAVARHRQPRAAGAEIERILLPADQAVRSADDDQARDRRGAADLERVRLDPRPIPGRDATLAEVGDHRRHLAPCPEPLVDDPLELGRLGASHHEGLALVRRLLLELRLQGRKRQRGGDPDADDDPSRAAAGRERGHPGQRCASAVERPAAARCRRRHPRSG